VTWTCINSEERLAEFLEGQLEAAERAQMEAHLAECAACRALAAQVQWISTRLPHLEPEIVPSGLVYRILEATSGTAERKPAMSWKEFLSSLLSPRFALGLGTVAATLFILFQALGINPKKISADSFNPVNIYRSANQQAHLTYARGVRFVNDLRVVYEIRSRLQEASATPAPATEQEAPKRPASPQSEQNLKNNLLQKGSSLIASALPAPGRAGWMGGGL